MGEAPLSAAKLDMIESKKMEGAIVIGKTYDFVLWLTKR
jgi:hypothetical protein